MRGMHRKHHQRLFSRIVIPTIILLILLPPCTCTIFYFAAKSYAYREAENGLDEFQESLIPIIESSFSDEADQTTQETTFLKQVGPLIAKMHSGASLMILQSKMSIIYPRDEGDRESVSPLAEQFAVYIKNAGQIDDRTRVEITTDDGTTYLANIYEVKKKAARVKYIIAYYPAKEIGSWVGQVSKIILLISSVFVAIIILILWAMVHSMTKPMKRICAEAERIGNGNFEDIQPEFSIRELEDLRISMNRMSDQLAQNDTVQRTFFQNVSHELRNPLMSISGYAQGIEQGIFASPTDAAHTILEESGRLSELVNGLLTLSRMENEENKPEMQSLILSDLIGDCIDRINGLAIQSEIQIIWDDCDQSMIISANEELFGKILDNLMTNAIRYAKSKVVISVDQKNGSIIVSVSDNGDGIAEKDLPHIFERCYKGKGGNFGIGLTLAKSAAQMMNAELTAQNQKDSGAVFQITFQK